jgi:hypothetical protein
VIHGLSTVPIGVNGLHRAMRASDRHDPRTMPYLASAASA